MSRAAFNSALSTCSNRLARAQRRPFRETRGRRKPMIGLAAGLGTGIPLKRVGVNLANPVPAEAAFPGCPSVWRIEPEPGGKVL